MEPAGDRRDDIATPYGLLTVLTTPQWSPPVSGGTTGHVHALHERLEPAAMEPAGDRRDDRFRIPDVPGRRRLAAMEPAAGRRDNQFFQLTRRLTILEPQWSPPLGGGDDADCERGPSAGDRAGIEPRVAPLRV